ncbi:MAG: hypothetical protein GX567_12495 [Clostridia bacterium]|nr:hypothetical protein [Clostridia bacterium]
MSYCVNCGVELENNKERCPLCNTPVYNPLQKIDRTLTPSFPPKAGQVERVKNSDMAILLSIVLASTAISCGLLNLLVFKTGSWSFYIIGACMLLWVIFIPSVIYTKLSIYLSLLFDGTAISFYLWVIAFSIGRFNWYLRLALPIITLVTFLVILFVFLHRFFKTSILSTAIYLFGEIAFFCIGLEMLICFYQEKMIRLTWSSVVLVSCSIIVITLLTIITRSRLREAVRRRMHM